MSTDSSFDDQAQTPRPDPAPAEPSAEPSAGDGIPSDKDMPLPND